MLRSLGLVTMSIRREQPLPPSRKGQTLDV